jgi:hypothetical protein
MLSPDERPVVVRRLVSCIALVPGIDVGWKSLELGISGLLIAAELVGFLARSYRHEVAGAGPGTIDCASPV